MYTCIHADACVCTHTRTHTRTHTHTHTHNMCVPHTRSLPHARMLSHALPPSRLIVPALSPFLAVYVCLSLRVSLCASASSLGTVTIQKNYKQMAETKPNYSLSLSFFFSFSLALSVCTYHCFWQASDSVCTTVLTVTLSKKKKTALRAVFLS